MWISQPDKYMKRFMNGVNMERSDIHWMIIPVQIEITTISHLIPESINTPLTK